jgi:hypothetical protein
MLIPILENDGIVDHRDVFFSDDEKAANTKLYSSLQNTNGRQAHRLLFRRSAQH